MIDIHCHILPQIDVGPSHVEEAIRLAEQAVKDGVHQVIATPYATEVKGEDVRLITQEMNVLLAQRQIPLHIYPGHQARLTLSLVDEVEAGHVIPLAGSRYLLIDCPNETLPGYTEMILDDLLDKGYVPILAHPEDNRELRENPARLIQLTRNGVLAQVATASVIGLQGKEKQAFSLEALRQHWAKLIGSNARHARTRGIYFGRCFEVLAHELSQDEIATLKQHAESVLLDRWI